VCELFSYVDCSGLPKLRWHALADEGRLIHCTVPKAESRCLLDDPRIQSEKGQEELGNRGHFPPGHHQAGTADEQRTS
jgi:hypothetical protein